MSIYRRIASLSLKVFLGVALVWYISEYVIPDEEEDGQARQEGSKAADEGGEAKDAITVPETMPEDAFFIPIGFTKERPKTRYKKNDPEWQSFVDISKDLKRRRRIEGTRFHCLSKTFILKRIFKTNWLA